MKDDTKFAVKAGLVAVKDRVFMWSMGALCVGWFFVGIVTGAVLLGGW